MFLLIIGGAFIAWILFLLISGHFSACWEVVRIIDKRRIEHFHTTDFERGDGKTMVTISTPPKIVASVKFGDRIEIPAADITDWSYMRDGKYVGMFTMKPRFKHMPADQVEAFKRVMTDP